MREYYGDSEYQQKIQNSPDGNSVVKLRKEDFGAPAAQNDSYSSDNFSFRFLRGFVFFHFSSWERLQNYEGDTMKLLSFEAAVHMFCGKTNFRRSKIRRRRFFGTFTCVKHITKPSG
ncbi:hypothetical protein ACS3QZ_18860 [Shimia sp. W99]